ncbi:smoothelin-like 2 protein-like [Scleropages formosus]|uniref:Smoothelin-like 2 protein-like n=1 Tax=Scleropages formosus TaxID=113540 RepID=A0A0P7VPB7_SCLFO|nr:smoothelin-like 2 protein-like [Scleropages formosus]
MMLCSMFGGQCEVLQLAPAGQCAEFHVEWTTGRGTRTKTTGEWRADEVESKWRYASGGVRSTGVMDSAGESPVEGETVCAALARYEATLQAAVCELHADVGAFKLGVERRLEEVDHLTGPLSRAVAQLQQENRQLRIQLEALTRRVEALTGTVCDRSAIVDSNSNDGDGTTKPNTLESMSRPYSSQEALQSTTCQSATSTNSEGSAPSTGVGPILGSAEARFSSRATIAVFSKNNSTEREEPIDVDPTPARTVLENGHQANSGVVSQELRLCPGDPPQEHPASMARSRFHLPITATTKASEPPASPITKAPEPLGSPARAQAPLPMESQLTSQPASSNALFHPVSEPLSQPGERNLNILSCHILLLVTFCVSKSSFVCLGPPPSVSDLNSVISAPEVKTWAPGPVKTMGSPAATDRTSSLLSKSVTYSPLTPPSTDRGIDGDKGMSFGRAMEKRRELVRSQTLPRSIGAQPRRPGFERLDSEPIRPKALDSKPKLKRSQSFGVSSASSIKQILLEWCRSKTIGYQNIDIQNFSSSWSDGMAFCALVHSFFPTEFDYNALLPANRKHNFEVAFSTAEEKAGCDRLIEVEDMMVMGHKPDPMCVFTYVQSLYNHLRRFE